MAQTYFDVKKLFDISENVFSPKPKVKSSFVRLSAREYPFYNKNHEDIFYDKNQKVSILDKNKIVGTTTFGDLINKKDLWFFVNNKIIEYDYLKFKSQLQLLLPKVIKPNIFYKKILTEEALNDATRL